MGRQVEGAAIATVGLHRHGHATAAEAQVQQLGHRLLVFAQHVVPNHPQLGLAVGHIDGHIGIAHQQGPGAAAGTGHHQQAVVRVEQGREIEARLGEATH